MIYILYIKVMIILTIAIVSFILGYYYGKKVQKYKNNQS
jgi:hypothetical protein